MRIKSFSNFINEKLGIVDFLEEIADDVIKKLSNKNYYQLKTNWRGKEVTIDFYINKGFINTGSFKITDIDNLEFEIRLKKLSKSTLIHELKHLDRTITSNLSKKIKYDNRSIITHITNFVTKNFSNLFKDKEAAEFLSLAIYYSNPDEFESYFNGFYNELKTEINDSMTKSEKRKIIENKLNSEAIFIFYKFYYSKPFNLKDFFNNNNNLNTYLKEYKRYLGFFLKGKAEIIGTTKIVLTIINKIINRLKKDESPDPLYHEINKIVNQSIQRNYRKFYRLYALLD
jgi:hypothetical protein